MSTSTLLVRRAAFDESRIDTREDTPLSPGQVRVRVDLFSFTANNVTYAAFGDAMHYWQFFPTPHEGWGIVPVWGFGAAVQSLHPGVAVGERLYGYWPMASHAVLQPERLTENGFRDGAQHRASLHPVYNQYMRASRDPFHAGTSEAVQALLRPLFATSWLIDDFLADNDFFGARTLLLSSASSKTAYGTAFLLSKRPGVEVVGLTSAGNRAFTESLGCYSRVLTYDELDSVDAAAECVYVDFAGNAELRRRIHERFTHLRYSCSVGGTHVEQLGGAKDLPGPRATLFFAPAQSKKRQEEWGGETFGRRLVESWRSFAAWVSEGERLVVQHGHGAAEIQQVYANVLAGRSHPREGHVLSFA
jgi:hypothetical protein